MNRQYDEQEIDQLLTKFMAGETTLNEEEALANYFRAHEVDEEWQEYKEMFALFDNGQVDIILGAETSRQLNIIENGKMRKRPKAVKGKPKIIALHWRAAGIAATVMLLIGIFLLMKNGKPKEELSAMTQQDIEDNSPRPVPPQTIMDKKEETLAEVQSTPKPVKKRRKAARKRHTPADSEITIAAYQEVIAEPASLEAEGDQTLAYQPDLQDPSLDLESQIQNIRIRGERLQRKLDAMFVGEP